MSKTRADEGKKDITALAIEGDLEGIKQRVAEGQNVNFRNRVNKRNMHKANQKFHKLLYREDTLRSIGPVFGDSST